MIAFVEKFLKLEYNREQKSAPRIFLWARRKTGGIEVTFFGYFLQYVIIMIILAAVGIAGVFAGKNLRGYRNAKQMPDGQDEK